MKYPIALLMLTLCGAAVAAPYSAPIRQQYLSSCAQAMKTTVPQVNNSASYCACTLEKIEQRVSEAEFIESGLNMENNPNHAAVKKVKQASEASVRACVQQIQKP